jgi:hypothetical protein
MCCPPSFIRPLFWTSLSFLHNKRTRLLVSYTGETILFFCLPRVCLSRRCAAVFMPQTLLFCPTWTNKGAMLPGGTIENYPSFSSILIFKEE